MIKGGKKNLKGDDTGMWNQMNIAIEGLQNECRDPKRKKMLRKRNLIMECRGFGNHASQ